MANASNGAPPKPVRCAIYTRKSTEEGLDQAFNSLDAQREAAEAYIRSQAGEGWTVLATQYDDGGYTGANMDRPALKRLLADVEAGKVDCVVVYKVDRLTRSLFDFARIIEVLDKHGASFVAVTQQFNTTTSLGRLTLNILLSFAQFEREIISERTRDKQIAARKKGQWTGGRLVLGYDLDPRGGRLLINPEEAERVRAIFNWYLEGEPVSRIVERCARLGWRNKQWTTKKGKAAGGYALRKCHIYQMLANPLYAGRVRADGELHRAEHEPIIDEQSFELVQEKLKQNAPARDSPHRRRTEALLRGLLYCASCGAAMYPTYSTNGHRQYRYYICVRSTQRTDGYCTTRAVSAPAVEEAVIESIRLFAAAPEAIEGCARAARKRVAEQLARLREELQELNARVKNWKSQMARMREPEPERQAALRAQIAAGEARTAEVRKEILRLEKLRLDEKALRAEAGGFDRLWQVLILEEQIRFVRQLVEKVGYDGRTGKVRVSFKSSGIKELCTGEARS
ncbi:MAG: recombinase family protein [Bryobacteraceae bacterium]